MKPIRPAFLYALFVAIGLFFLMQGCTLRHDTAPPIVEPKPAMPRLTLQAVVGIAEQNQGSIERVQREKAEETYRITVVAPLNSLIDILKTLEKETFLREVSLEKDESTGRLTIVLPLKEQQGLMYSTGE